MKSKTKILFNKQNLNIHVKKIDGYNYVIGPCRFFLRLLGAWPNFHYRKNWTSLARILLVTSTMLFFGTISQTVKMILSWKNLNLVTEILTNCNIPTSIATVKIISICYHRYVLKDLLHQIMQDWKMAYDEREMMIMWKNARISRLLSIGCIFMTEGTLFTQFIIGIISPVSYIIKFSINETVKKPLYMMGSFPYNVQVTPNYELSILGQLLSNVFASTSFSSTDSLFIVLMFHLIGQLSILKLALFKLPNKIQNEADKKKFIDKVSFIHMRHNQLWRFSMSIEQAFNMMFLIQIIPCIFVLCTQVYQLIMIISADNVSIMELIFVIYFLLLFLFTIFMYCYVAEILRQKSTEVSYAAYNCDWTILPAREARLLVFIIIRAQHPFEITVGKFATFSLQLYCHILKTSAGYLSMLLALKDRMID